MPSVGELLHLEPPPVCVCGRIIPDTAIYYGFPLSEDNDEQFAWINEWHDNCLGEWGWVRDDSEFGIRHRYCDDDLIAA